MLLLRSQPAFSGLLAAAAVLLFSLGSVAAAQDARHVWTDLAAGADAPQVDRATAPTEYRALALDFEAIAAHLAAAPEEQMPGQTDGGVLVALPLPNGEFVTYRMVESSVMQPGLQARYPNIRTYLGHEPNLRRSTVRVSVTPQGFHAMAFHPDGTFYVEPMVQHDRDHAMSYWRSTLPPRDPHLHPIDEVEPANDDFPGIDPERSERIENGEILRTYRIAIGTTFGYTSFHSSGTANVEDALAAMVVAMNRINGIYERDLAVRMLLVENNDEVIFTTSADDPYPSGISGTLLNVNQNTLDSIIGSANYDIGHVFTTAGGGLAQLRSVCTASKARGATGLPNPINDPFYVDYVSHEIGHQFGANHTFNASIGGCGANRNPGTAYEPGSGSTIMAYSGLCGVQNIQTFADDYFHNISLTEMITFMTTGAGGVCAEETPTGNAIPQPIASAGPQIPIETPFMLPGDVEYDGDPEDLTFIWEEMDLGPAGPPPGRPDWNFTPPFFRTFQPSGNSDRFFPRVERIVLGLSTLGEGLPNSTRLLRFRLTVRNNAPGGGAVQDVSIIVPSAAGAGPFVVTSQDAASNTVWYGGTEKTVEWDVANTNSSTYGAENVDILLSTNRAEDFVDGTYIVLAEAVPNNGAAVITVPNDLESSQARIFVRASNGFFFSYNTRDISLFPGTSTDQQPDRAEVSLGSVYPNPLGVAGSRGTINLSVENSQNVVVAVFDALGRQVMTLHDGPVSAGVNHQFDVPAGQLAAGTYYVRAVGDRFSEVRPMTVVH